MTGPSVDHGVLGLLGFGAVEFVGNACLVGLAAAVARQEWPRSSGASWAAVICGTLASFCELAFAFFCFHLSASLWVGLGALFTIRGLRLGMTLSLLSMGTETHLVVKGAVGSGLAIIVDLLAMLVCFGTPQ